MRHVMEWLKARLEKAERLVAELTNAPKVEFERRNFPDKPGVYAISKKDAKERDFLRCGATEAGLKQRLYQNHLEGQQKGNLAQQLVSARECSDVEAKKLIRHNCVVQYIVIEDGRTRDLAEKVVEGLLAPRFVGRKEREP